MSPILTAYTKMNFEGLDDRGILAATARRHECNDLRRSGFAHCARHCAAGDPEIPHQMSSFSAGGGGSSRAAHAPAAAGFATPATQLTSIGPAVNGSGGAVSKKSRVVSLFYPIVSVAGQ
jgi:hypothetical protein